MKEYNHHPGFNTGGWWNQHKVCVVCLPAPERRFVFVRDSGGTLGSCHRLNFCQLLMTRSSCYLETVEHLVWIETCSMFHLEEVTYFHSLNSFGFWLLGWSSCWTDAEAQFYYLQRLICAEQACSFWAASQGSRSLLCSRTCLVSRWRASCRGGFIRVKQTLAFKALGSSDSQHPSLAVSTDPPCLCSQGSLCWSYRS